MDNLNSEIDLVLSESFSKFLVEQPESDESPEEADREEGPPSSETPEEGPSTEEAERAFGEATNDSEAQKIAKIIPQHVKLIDLSADFRLNDILNNGQGAPLAPLLDAALIGLDTFRIFHHPNSWSVTVGLNSQMKDISLGAFLFLSAINTNVGSPNNATESLSGCK